MNLSVAQRVEAAFPPSPVKWQRGEDPLCPGRKPSARLSGKSHCPARTPFRAKCLPAPGVKKDPSEAKAAPALVPILGVLAVATFPLTACTCLRVSAASPAGKGT